MFLNHKSDGKMVEVLSLNDLFNPNHHEIVGRFQAGEELQDPEKFSKTELEFLSGEALPKCLLDVHYRDNELRR